MTMRLNEAYKPISRQMGIASNMAIPISMEGTIQANHHEKLVSSGDCPNCTLNFSKSSSLLNEAYINRMINIAAMISVIL